MNQDEFSSAQNSNSDRHRNLNINLELENNQHNFQAHNNSEIIHGNSSSLSPEKALGRSMFDVNSQNWDSFQQENSMNLGSAVENTNKISFIENIEIVPKQIPYHQPLLFVSSNEEISFDDEISNFIQNFLRKNAQNGELMVLKSKLEEHLLDQQF